MRRIISDVFWLSDIRKVRGDYDPALSLMTGPKTQGYFPHRKLTHSITTKHTHFPKFKENIQTGNGSLLQFENLISKKNEHVLCVFYWSLCVFESVWGTRLNQVGNIPSRFRLDITKVCYGFSHSLLFITVQSSWFHKNF